MKHDELIIGNIYYLYQRDIFNEKEYLYRGMWKFINKYEDKDVIFINSRGEKYMFPLQDINNGFWRFN